MDIDITEIEGRIRGEFARGHETLFWEDEPGEYAQVVGTLSLGDGSLIDVSGAELACKRAILRDRPSRNIVVYRSGARPRPEDDFLYDIKLSATPFTCKMEGLWATECGIAPQLTGMLGEHERFFGSKERRGALAASGLDKASEAGLRLAMLAACAGSKADTPRDAVRDTVRRLLAELGRGQSRTLRAVSECGLAPTLWACVSDALGYAAPAGEDPTVEDLALKMLQSRCGALMAQATPLKADAERILGELAANGRTRDAYDALAREYGEAIASAIGPELRNAKAIGTNDTLPVFDEWAIADVRGRVLAGTMAESEAEAVANARRHTLWYERYANEYGALTAAAGMLERAEAYRRGRSSVCTETGLFEAYRDEWHGVDQCYRRFTVSMRAAGSGFRRRSSELPDKVNDAYGKFLADLTERWQAHLMDAGSYPPPGIPSQAGFFHERVTKEFPRAEGGKRLGVIVSDAMRYEVGADLARRVNAGALAVGRGRVKASCDAMACMLPSYTQLGMAALLPEGALEIDPSTANVAKGGEPTEGTANRQAIVEKAMPGALLIQASKVLEEGMPPVDGAPLVMVFHNAIDKRGDSRDTEGEVFAACEDAIAQVATLAGELLRAGCSKVVVTADHGFLYQDRQVEEHNYAEVEGLTDLAGAEGVGLFRSRRFAVGTTLPQSDALVEYSPAQLSLSGDYKVAMPRGVTRMRLRGSGARYVHGGASLQEDVVPVVTICAASRSDAPVKTSAQGFLCGRPSITGSTVALDVYQVQPCSEKVLPLTVKVGLYDPDDAGRLLCAEEASLELASAAASSEERKTRVELRVTDDVDDCAAAVLRISSRVGNTNQYGTEWEQRLSVNRAFGSDF